MKGFLKIAVALLCVPVMLSARGRATEAADGVFLRQLQKRDSVLIADQLKYGVRLNGLPEGTRILLPEWHDTVTANVDIVQPWQIDTLSYRKATKTKPAEMDIEAYLIITSFEEGLHDLPGIDLVRWAPNGVADSLSYEYQQLVVTTLPVDTATFEVHEIKDQIRYPVTFKELAPYIFGGLLLIGLIVLAVWLVKRYLARKKGEEEARKEPAHIVALRKLDKWRGDKFWEPEHQKEFYSGVTDALREYIDARFGVSAMEMTTYEIFDALKKEEIPDDLRASLKELFERADFVKFAKHSADRDENASVLPTAVRFVTSTYQVEVEEEAAGNSGEPVKKGE